MLSIPTHTHTHAQAGHKETFGGDDMFITIIVVMASRVYTYVQTYQMVYIDYIQPFWYTVIP